MCVSEFSRHFLDIVKMWGEYQNNVWTYCVDIGVMRVLYDKYHETYEILTMYNRFTNHEKNKRQGKCYRIEKKEKVKATIKEKDCNEPPKKYGGGKHNVNFIYPSE